MPRLLPRPSTLLTRDSLSWHAAVNPLRLVRPAPPTIMSSLKSRLMLMSSHRKTGNVLLSLTNPSGLLELASPPLPNRPKTHMLPFVNTSVKLPVPMLLRTLVSFTEVLLLAQLLQDFPRSLILMVSLLEVPHSSRSSLILLTARPATTPLSLSTLVLTDLDALAVLLCAPPRMTLWSILSPSTILSFLLTTWNTCCSTILSTVSILEVLPQLATMRSL
mmetsp:Transcript_21084/g.29322  ORF Transcript_21084/g.29322 Transcript_21084/m.29322 type:complete len:219 (-) Transcript_21084:564-1220(-)